ncbi:WecB/TagA/CpsF family glycosyltransferase [Nitrosomonas sp.]|uniref:WecB/TagA/CpsF family glycosyltransferase n=1 Tax=Nitrosomonas sp. TaxID=42353 RepID=UPI0025DE2D1E|nr:WecB/TagA/CpsF family glycosyltransferase [Nitrosomonas sp.]
MNQIPLFGLKIEDTTLADASANIVNDARSGVQRKIIYFVNAHCINIAAVDIDYLSVLQDGATLFADGSGMRLAARLAGFSLKDNVNGTDLFPVICHDAAAAGVKLALLGARPGVAERCAEKMKIQSPKLDVAWIHDGYFKQDTEDDIIDAINRSGAEILFVAMGVPMQELWIARHVNKLNVAVVLGVGALFDFYSGAMPRAPQWMRRLGLEWLFRYMMEPRRMFVRYVVGNPVFIIRTLWRCLKGQKNLQEAALLDGKK